MGHRDLALEIVGEMAFLAVADWKGERAARLQGAEITLRERLAIPMAQALRESSEETLDAIRAMLTEEEFTDAWKRGQSMSFEEAMAYALEESRPAPN